MNILKQKIQYLTLFLCAITFFFPVFCKADESIQSTSDRLTVVPPKAELWAEPGKTVEQTLRITNESNDDAIVAFSIENFSVAGDDGSIVLGQNFSLPNHLQSWITFDNKAAQFKPKETKLINYKIDVPKDAFPGGNYAAIVVSMDKVNRQPNENTAVAKVMSLVLLSITGDIRDDVNVENYQSSKSLIKGKTVYDFTLKLKNNGNNHIRPTGSIIITNFFGQKIEEIPLNGENVLPNVSRVMKTQWQPQKTLLGRYNANLVATYGYKADKKIAISTSFYVFPWWSKMVLTLIVIFVLIILYNRVIKSPRNKKQ